MKLTDHIKDTEEKCFAAFEKNPSLTSWRWLADVALAHVACFNKRRSGDAQRTKLKDWHERTYDSGSEGAKSKTSVEAALKQENQLTHLLVQGKGLRWVPVLLTKIMDQALSL